MPPKPVPGKGILAIALVLAAAVAPAPSDRASPPAPPAPPPPPPPAPLDAAMRARILKRLAEEGTETYLPAMLVGGDSTLRRWGDDRAARPLRVAVARGDVPGFVRAFVTSVAWAVSRWNSVGLPISLDVTTDTTGADIVVTWADRLDGNRTGRADLTWLPGGPISHAHLILATHTPDGRAVVPAQMAALALHELGHALGLGHSPVSTDALYPETSATDLTRRDRRTAVLLYSLPPGNLR